MLLFKSKSHPDNFHRRFPGSSCLRKETWRHNKPSEHVGMVSFKSKSHPDNFHRRFPGSSCVRKETWRHYKPSEHVGMVAEHFATY